MTSTGASSLSTVQLMYLCTAAIVMPWISFKIYALLNAEVLQGNAAVLPIIHSFKRMITSERNLHWTIAQQFC